LHNIWKKQAYRSDADTQYKLGLYFENLIGYYRRHDDAAHWYEIAAEQGHAEAQYRLGEYYRLGWGYAEGKDYRKLIYWHRKAAKQGHAEAQYSIGFCYYYGSGVKQDYEKALYWYTKAAEQGHTEARFCLWFSYKHGEGTERDNEKAAYWLKLAADNGDEDAEKIIANQNKTETTKNMAEKYLQGLKQAYYDKDFQNYWENFESRKYGASEDDINKLKKKFPDVPDCLLNLLEFVDGTYHSKYMGEYMHLDFFGSDEKYNDPDTDKEVRWSYTYYLFSVKEMLNSRDSLDYSVKDLREEGFQSNKIRKGKVKTQWLHFADCSNNGGSSQLYIDFSPSVRGRIGQVVQYCHDPDELNVIADSFDEYLEMLMNNGYNFIQD
jgi:cell wall assembly regulator SMI1